MSNLPVFAHPEFGKVRILKRDSEPWFVARDVALALGYEKPQNAISTHCKKANKITQSPDSGRSANSPPVNILIIPEMDVYRLIMRSNLPDAERFQDWVVEEVLPSIRKTGRYSVEPAQLLPYQVIRTLPKSAKDRLNDLVNTKLAHVAPKFSWGARMRIWNRLKKAFGISRYELLPEARMVEAITFLTGLDVGHGGTVTCKVGLIPLTMSTAQTTAESLAAAIEQGQALLASLSEHTA